MKIRILWIAAAVTLAAPLSAYASNVQVTSGGVGEGSRAELMRAYGDYNLHVAFAEKSGAFLADVEVTIRDARGNVVWQGISEGPMLFARLPSGRYSVAAQFNGETKRREVSVSGRPAKMHYVHWDLADVPERASAGR
jgi:hypothetical protein